MKNSLHILSSIAVITLFSSCATTETSTSAAQTSGVNADYDGDGIISDTEYQKYKQLQGIQETNTDPNTTLPNISKTSRTVRDTLWTVQALKNFF